MADDEPLEGANPLGTGAEGEIKELLGLFDSPAFVRRGTDVEFALRRLRERLKRERLEKLDMVHLRLKQWAKAATGPDDYRDGFRAPIAPFYELTGAEPPAWSKSAASSRTRRAIAADFVKSLERFNRRWLETMEGLRLDPINRQIEKYNKYYVLEKECVLGSTRLALRHFVPKVPLTLEELSLEFPLLPVIEKV